VTLFRLPKALKQVKALSKNLVGCLFGHILKKNFHPNPLVTLLIGSATTRRRTSRRR